MPDERNTNEGEVPPVGRAPTSDGPHRAWDHVPMLDDAPVGIGRATLDGALLYVNDALRTMMGFESPAEMIRDGALARYKDPDERAPLITRLKRDRVIQNHETVVLTKHGEERTILASMWLEGDVVTAMMTDISARKRAEAQLEAHGRRLAFMADASRAFAEVVSEYDQLLDRIARTATEFLCDFCIVRVLSDDERWLNPAGFHYDDPREAEFIRGLLGRAPLSVDEPNLDQKVFAEGRALLVPVIDVERMMATVKPEYREGVQRYRPHSMMIVPLRVRGKSTGLLGLYRNRSGQPAFNDVDLVVAQDLADRAALAINNARLFQRVQQELADHKRTRAALEKSEANFRQAQKMEAIGRLAGGVAHDFNNILSVVLGYSEMLLAELRPDARYRHEIDQIRLAGRRGADLTRQLLAFSRKQILSLRALDLNTVVSRLEPMLQRIIGEDIALQFHPTAGLGLCLADAGQMEQLLMNLIVNSRDAMPEGGRITIETANAVLDQSYVDEHEDASVGPHVTLCVTDTGAGMDQATLARIFEPFFTTKPQELGSGLGLATVYGIVRQSGGSIWVYSEVGQGTTFKIYLPRIGEHQAVDQDAATPIADDHGSETILLVEDETQVRGLVRGILTRAGYRVLEASHGAEAIQVAESHTGPIHLLVTDVVMPRLSGRQVAQRLLETRPALAVLYMSGYTENAIVHHGVLDPDVHFIPKPITPEALRRKVREVLDGAAR